MNTTGEQVHKSAQLQSGVVMTKDRTWVLKKYNVMFITEALEVAVQRLTAHAARLKRGATDAEAKGVSC